MSVAFGCAISVNLPSARRPKTMQHLAIECSGHGGSVALYVESVGADLPARLLAQGRLPTDRGSVQTLAETIAEILRAPGAAFPLKADLISVTVGPGSFTGLRVGLATAKMLAMAWRVPVAPIDTLDVLALAAQHFLASQVPTMFEADAAGSGIVSTNRVRVFPVLNAFRKQVFTAAWESDGPQSSPPGERDHQTGARRLAVSQVVDAAKWESDVWSALQLDPEHGEGESPEPNRSTPAACWAIGLGLNVYRPGLAGGAAVQLVPEPLWTPQASDVGKLGWQAFQQGRCVSAAELAPNYIRASAAEEKKRQG